MRFFLVAAMILPLAVQAVQAASPLPGKTIKIKDEILNNCGNFPYAPTLAMDAKTATLEDMKRARKVVDDYISEVSYYEKCLLSLDKKLGSTMTEKDSTYIVFVFNRAQEERDVLSLDFNKMVDTYNAANGITPEPEKKAKPAKPAKPTAAAKPAAAKPATPKPN